MSDATQPQPFRWTSIPNRVVVGFLDLEMSAIGSMKPRMCGHSEVSSTRLVESALRRASGASPENSKEFAGRAASKLRDLDLQIVVGITFVNGRSGPLKWSSSTQIEQRTNDPVRLEAIAPLLEHLPQPPCSQAQKLACRAPDDRHGN